MLFLKHRKRQRQSQNDVVRDLQDTTDHTMDDSSSYNKSSNNKITMNATSNHTNTHSNSYWKQPLPRVWLLVPNQLSILVVRLLRTHHPVLVIVVLLLILLLLFVVLLFLLHYYSSNSNNNYHLFDLNYDNQYTDHSSSSTSYYGLLGGYDRLGNWMDQHRIQQYHYSTTTNPSYTNNPTILYPLVQLRANLKNRMGYSLYLYEILRRNNYYTSANTSTTMTTTKHSITSSSIESNDYNSYSTYEITNIHSNDDNTTSMNGGSSNMNSKKYSIQHTLDQNTCYIHWRCHRCLHSPYHGTIRQCTFAQNSHDHYLFPDFYYPCPNCLVQSFDSLFPKSTLSANDNQQQQQLQPHRITISSSINYHDNSDNSNDDTNNTSQRNVTSSRKDNGDDMDQQQRNRRRIPYIVHQSWYHDIDSMEYPELSRIQYAWKSMITSSHANYYNNRYNFYRSNEKDEINYIILHFPPLFQEVYNRIGTTSSASHSHHNDIQRRPQQQHNFFRFLVLYREGGIWSNIDFLPETNIQHYLSFQNPNVSMIVARRHDNDETPTTTKISSKRTDQQHCIWDGFIVCTPGHPIIQHIIEGILTSVLLYESSFDYILAYTMLQQSMLTSNVNHDHYKDIELWKLLQSTRNTTTSPSTTTHSSDNDVNNNIIPNIDEYLYGGCAVGMAINFALNTSNLFDDLILGRHSIIQTTTATSASSSSRTSTSSTDDSSSDDTTDWGEINILLMSQDDTGAYRCTDIEHNILVGSTDMIGLNQLSVRQRSDLSRRNDMIDKNT